MKVDLMQLKDPNRSSSCPEVFCKTSVLKKFAKLTGKQLCQSLFFKFFLKINESRYKQC